MVIASTLIQITNDFVSLYFFLIDFPASALLSFFFCNFLNLKYLLNKEWEDQQKLTLIRADSGLCSHVLWSPFMLCPLTL